MDVYVFRTLLKLATSPFFMPFIWSEILFRKNCSKLASTRRAMSPSKYSVHWETNRQHMLAVHYSWYGNR